MLLFCTAAIAITGVFYVSKLLVLLTGWYSLAVIAVCFGIFSLITAKQYLVVLQYLNYGTLLLLPLIVGMAITIYKSDITWESKRLSITVDFWFSLLPLFGYNAGALRLSLSAETGVRLADRRHKCFLLIILTHCNETLITLVLTSIVLAVNASSPLTVVKAAQTLLGINSGYYMGGCILYHN